jgi:hypothetical protein
MPGAGSFAAVAAAANIVFAGILAAAPLPDCYSIEACSFST